MNRPEPPKHEEGVAEILKDMHPMWIAACVLGFNELAKQAKNLGDRIYFQSFRDLLHEALQKSGSDWTIELKPQDPTGHGQVP